MGQVGLVYFQHGDKIRTRSQRLPGWHYGVFDAERAMVIHNTVPGGVQYVAFADFANGDVFIEQRAPAGREDIVIWHARRLLGTQYDLLAFNCEHFANLVVTGKKESPQLQRAVAWTGLLGLAAAVFEVGPFSATKYDRRVGQYRNKRTGRFERG